jgi:hypothetical protein
MRGFVAAALVLACSNGGGTAASNDDTGTTETSGGDTATTTDTNPTYDTAVFATPTEVKTEVIFVGPARTRTSAAWNAHLPKLAGDDKFLYAVHTHFTEDLTTRFAAIMRRSAGKWAEVARVEFPHQPPGIVMDTKNQLHMVFDCLRPGTKDVTCFQGGAGTGGIESRFYHLIFSARDTDGALKFDTYGNYNEFTTQSNGYHGLGVTSDGATIFSTADATWKRVIMYRSGDMTGTVATLSRPDTYLLYPIHAARDSKSLVLHAGEFDPKGGTNAGYPASVGYEGDLSSLTERFRLTPSTMVAAGAVGSYPSDVVLDDKGVAYVLSYRLDGPNCTELRRFDDGLSKAPKVTPLGCMDNYAKLQISSDGTVWVLASSNEKKVLLGWSRDRGATFDWKQLPVVGGDPGDVRFYGASPIKPYTSPGIYDPDKLVFFFVGANSSGESNTSYLGTIALKP